MLQSFVVLKAVNCALSFAHNFFSLICDRPSMHLYVCYSNLRYLVYVCGTCMMQLCVFFKCGPTLYALLCRKDVCMVTMIPLPIIVPFVSYVCSYWFIWLLCWWCFCSDCECGSCVAIMLLYPIFLLASVQCRTIAVYSLNSLVTWSNLFPYFSVHFHYSVSYSIIIVIMLTFSWYLCVQMWIGTGSVMCVQARYEVGCGGYVRTVGWLSDANIVFQHNSLSCRSS